MSTPLLILAPMYNVTDTVFRQIIAELAPPDLFMTEFVNVDGLVSPGRDKLLPYLYQEKTSVPLYAQIWGKNPANFYQVAKELAERGFDGIDLNFGCPEKNVLKNQACAGLINPDLRPLAKEIIEATKKGAGHLPVSIKTRLGLKEIDLSWHEFLLSQKPAMLSIHGRTVFEKSRPPANWEIIGQIKRLALKISPQTKIIGNGDIKTKTEGLRLCQRYDWDGAMIGRAILTDPCLFSSVKCWQQIPTEEKIRLYRRHLRLFRQTYAKQERNFHPLKKFMKVYLTNFPEAQEMRSKIATSQSLAEMEEILTF